jgi:hypothetical protein
MVEARNAKQIYGVESNLERCRVDYAAPDIAAQGRLARAVRPEARRLGFLS